MQGVGYEAWGLCPPRLWPVGIHTEIVRREEEIIRDGRDQKSQPAIADRWQGQGSRIRPDTGSQLKFDKKFTKMAEIPINCQTFGAHSRVQPGGPA